MAQSLPKTFSAAVVVDKGQELTLKELELKGPGKGEVLVKVLACGICHSDALMRDGYLPNAFPRVAGHELVGDVVAIGEGVTRFKSGDRVGGPWHGGMQRPCSIPLPPALDLAHAGLTNSLSTPTGHDGQCRSCQRGRFQACVNEQINGVTRDGGYAEYVLLLEEAVVRVPADLDPAETAPLLCAGVTVFNGMRKL